MPKPTHAFTDKFHYGADMPAKFDESSRMLHVEDHDIPVNLITLIKETDTSVKIYADARVFEIQIEDPAMRAAILEWLHVTLTEATIAYLCEFPGAGLMSMQYSWVKGHVQCLYHNPPKKSSHAFMPNDPGRVGVQYTSGAFDTYALDPRGLRTFKEKHLHVNLRNSEPNTTQMRERCERTNSTSSGAYFTPRPISFQK
jgi:hypothetical protein